MSSAAHTLAHRWFDEVWNDGNEATINELMLPEAQCFDFPVPNTVIGRDEFIQAVRNFRSTFTGIQVTVDDVIVDGNKVAMRWSARMNHTGEGLGFSATGEPVILSGISIVHLRDGKIITGWNALDLTAVVHKLNTIAAAR